MIERLDKHGDPFRTASFEVEIKPEVTARAPRAGAKTQTAAKQVDKQNTGAKKPATKRKSKADKVRANKSQLSINSHLSFKSTTSYKIKFKCRSIGKNIVQFTDYLV